MGVSGLIREDLVQTSLIVNNSIQGTLIVALPLLIPNWLGGLRYFLVVEKVAA